MANTKSCDSKIRLFNNQTKVKEDGIVQICNSETGWSSACDRGWDCKEANAACRELGYDLASK